MIRRFTVGPYQVAIRLNWPPIRIRREWGGVMVIPISGELLNDEYELINHPLAPFDPKKTYLVRYAALTRDVIGEWYG